MEKAIVVEMDKAGVMKMSLQKWKMMGGGEGRLEEQGAGEGQQEDLNQLDFLWIPKFCDVLAILCQCVKKKGHTYLALCLNHSMLA